MGLGVVKVRVRVSVDVSVSVIVSVKTNETDSDGMLRDKSESEGEVEDKDDILFACSHVPFTWKRSVVTHPPHPQHSVFKPMAGLGLGLRLGFLNPTCLTQWYTHRRGVFGFGFRQGAPRALLETKSIKY